jgi:hypothetical protein
MGPAGGGAAGAASGGGGGGSGGSSTASGGADDPGVSSAAAPEGALRSHYSLQGIYFERSQFGSTADCLTAASARALPLELCE